MHTVIEQKGIRTIHEGNRLEVTDVEGNTKISAFQEFGATMEISADEYESMTLSDVMKRIDETTEELRRQKSKYVYGTLEKITQEAGNVHDAEGNLTPEKFISIIGNSSVSFDKQGHPRMQFVAGPVAASKLVEVRKRIADDPKLLARWNEVMLVKKREWDDREATRKLVE